MLALVPFSVVGGLQGSGERDVGRTRWVIARVRHHGPLRLAHIRWVSVARARQVDAFPADVPDRQALSECVARSRVVGLYEGVLLTSLLGKVGPPGVVGVDGEFRSCWFDASRSVLWREEVVSGPPCRLLTCGWPVRDSRRACAAVHRRCTAGDWLHWAGHARAASGGAGLSRRCCSACS